MTKEVHAGDAGGHFEVEITIKKILQVGLWWESMKPDVITYYKKCAIYQQTGRPTASDMMPRVNIVPLEAFMKWGLDFMGPFKKVTQRKIQYVIVALLIMSLNGLRQKLCQRITLQRVLPGSYLTRSLLGLDAHVTKVPIS